MSGVAGDGLVHTYELMFRNLDSEQKRTLRKIERGDIIQVKNLEQFGDRWCRSGEPPGNTVDHAEADVLRDEFVGDVAAT